MTERHKENVVVLLFEIVLINSLLIVQKYYFYEKELSESLESVTCLIIGKYSLLSMTDKCVYNTCLLEIDKELQ